MKDDILFGIVFIILAPIAFVGLLVRGIALIACSPLHRRRKWK